MKNSGERMGTGARGTKQEQGCNFYRIGCHTSVGRIVAWKRALRESIVPQQVPARDTSQAQTEREIHEVGARDEGSAIEQPHAVS